MKKYSLIIAAAAIAVAIIATGCGEENKPATSETKATTASATTSATETKETKATKATQKATKATQKPTQKATKATSKVVETEPEPADFGAILTKRKKWNCEKCVKNGKEINVQDYYGSVVKETGTYIQFNKDGTFKCVMGFEGCEGTYKVSGNDVTVNKTLLYMGTKEKTINETEKLVIEGVSDIESITMKLNGVAITFA